MYTHYLKLMKLVGIIVCLSLPCMLKACLFLYEQDSQGSNYIRCCCVCLVWLKFTYQLPLKCHGDFVPSFKFIQVGLNCIYCYSNHFDLVMLG
jgi:hypothetical protein